MHDSFIAGSRGREERTRVFCQQVIISPVHKITCEALPRVSPPSKALVSVSGWESRHQEMSRVHQNLRSRVTSCLANCHVASTFCFSPHSLLVRWHIEQHQDSECSSDLPSVTWLDRGQDGIWMKAQLALKFTVLYAVCCVSGWPQGGKASHPRMPTVQCGCPGQCRSISRWPLSFSD